MKALFALFCIILAFWLLFVQVQDQPTRDRINQAAVDAVRGR